MMQDPKTGKRILDPVERAKLGLQVIAMSPDDATAAIDRYVDGKGYDEEGVAFSRTRSLPRPAYATKGQNFSIRAGRSCAWLPAHLLPECRSRVAMVTHRAHERES